MILFLGLLLVLFRFVLSRAIFMLSLFAKIASCICRLFAHCSAPLFMRIVAWIMMATWRNVALLAGLGRTGSAEPPERRRARSALLLLTKLAFDPKSQF
jgi:hypothetical protein